MRYRETSFSIAKLLTSIQLMHRDQTITFDPRFEFMAHWNHNVTGAAAHRIDRSMIIGTPIRDGWIIKSRCY